MIGLKGKSVEELKKTIKWLEYVSVEGISYYLESGIKHGYIREELRKVDNELIYFSTLKKQSKEEKMIEKSFCNLGYNSSDSIKTKSDLMLEISDIELFIQERKVIIEQATENLEKASKLLEIYREIENQYEVEVLRSLNPKLTIY